MVEMEGPAASPFVRLYASHLFLDQMLLAQGPPGISQVKPTVT